MTQTDYLSVRYTSSAPTHARKVLPVTPSAHGRAYSPQHDRPACIQRPYGRDYDAPMYVEIPTPSNRHLRTEDPKLYDRSARLVPATKYGRYDNTA